MSISPSAQRRDLHEALVELEQLEQVDEVALEEAPAPQVVELVAREAQRAERRRSRARSPGCSGTRSTPSLRHLNRYSTCAPGKWCSTTCIIVNLYRSVSRSERMITALRLEGVRREWYSGGGYSAGVDASRASTTRMRNASAIATSVNAVASQPYAAVAGQRAVGRLADDCAGDERGRAGAELLDRGAQAHEAAAHARLGAARHERHRRPEAAGHQDEEQRRHRQVRERATCAAGA